MYDNLNDKNIKQYFIYVTFKIILNKLKPYKLFAIKGFNDSDFKSVLCTLICFKYEE